MAPRFDFRHVEGTRLRPSTLCTDKKWLSLDGPMQDVIFITGPFERRSLSPRPSHERMVFIMRHNGWFEERLRTRKLGSASIERQSRIVKMAINHFGCGPTSMAFLNGTDTGLDGTPSLLQPTAKWVFDGSHNGFHRPMNPRR